MFTREDIESANARVKTGADFPRLAHELAAMGVCYNDVIVSDGGAARYISDGGHQVEIPGGEAKEVAEQCESGLFLARLKLHQSGGTDYPQFLADCAEAGIERWRIDFAEMTCTYFDRYGAAVLTEKLPT